MSRKCSLPPGPYLFDPGPPRAWNRRRRNFAPEPAAEEAAAVIRGAIVDALDKSFEDNILGVTLWQAFDAEAWGRTPDGTLKAAAKLPQDEAKRLNDADVRAQQFAAEVVELARDGDQLGILRLFQRYGLDVFQAMMVCLFPELFTKDEFAVGVIPRGGLERVGADRQETIKDRMEEERAKKQRQAVPSASAPTGSGRSPS